MIWKYLLAIITVNLKNKNKEHDNWKKREQPEEGFVILRGISLVDFFLWKRDALVILYVLYSIIIFWAHTNSKFENENGAV